MSRAPPQKSRTLHAHLLAVSCAPVVIPYDYLPSSKEEKMNKRKEGVELLQGSIGHEKFLSISCLLFLFYFFKKY